MEIFSGAVGSLAVRGTQHSTSEVASLIPLGFSVECHPRAFDSHSRLVPGIF